jgi:hypothetical protein
MGHPFDSCMAKLIRAHEHIQALKQTIESLGPNPYSIVEERNPHEGDRDFRLVAHDLTAFRRIPMLSVIVGDAVHQMRSSLDHAAWQIAKPPIERTTAFPICIERSGTRNSFYGSGNDAGIGVRYLKNVSLPGFEHLESIQPYNRLKERDELWLLNELWNKDKHRALIVLDRPTWRDTFVISTLGGRDIYDGEIKSLPKDDPDILLRLDAKSDSVVDFNPNPPLQVNFGEVGPLKGRGVLVTLNWLHKYVGGVVLPGLEPFL